MLLRNYIQRAGSLLLPALLLTLLFAAPAKAAQVSVAPPSSIASPGDTITLSVRVDSVTALGGFQFGLTYDPALLAVSAVRIDGAFATSVSTTFNNTAGNAMVAAAALATQPTGSNLRLAEVDLFVKARGTANLGLTNVILGKIGGAEIPSAASGGTVTISNFLLTVSTAGTGTGTVTSSPAGITCGADCSQAYLLNTAVTLTATPSPGSVFQSWGGVCTGVLATACTVTMDSDKTAVAVFKDATPPNAPIVSAATPTNSVRPVWTWRTGGGGGNGNYRFKLDSSDLSTGATDTTATVFTPSVDLIAGSHTLYVAELDADLNVSLAGSAAVLIDLTPPLPPSGLSAAFAQTGVRLTWTHSASPDIAKYRIYGNGGSGPIDYVLPVGMIAYPVSAYTAGTVTTGTYQFGVRAVDAAGNEEQNTSVTASATVADFTVTLGVTKGTYSKGENVPISGLVRTTALAPVSGAAVEISVNRSGFVRRYTAYTDASGAYSYTFQPTVTEGGLYAVQASVLYGGMTHTAGASFAIEGLVLSPVNGALSMSMNSGKTVNISVTSIGTGTVTGLQYSITDAAPGDGVGATIDTGALPTQLGPGASVAVPVVINAGPTTPPAVPAVFTLRVTSDQGMNETATITTTLSAATAIPVITPNPLQLGVLAGTTAVKNFTISNQGYLDMLATTVAVHDPATFPWVTVSNCAPSNIGNLGTKTCQVAAAPSAMGHYVVQLDLIFNSTITPFYLTVDVTTSNVGQVSFKVNDDTGAVVNGAEVALISMATYSSVTPQGVTEYNNVFKVVSGATGSAGYARFTDIPAGDYRYVINAAKHDSLEGRVTVEPGTAVQTIPVVLVAQLVNVDFSVTPTTITDTYTVTVNITYVTDLIKPTLYASPSRVDLSMFPEETYSGVLTIKNASNNAPVRDLVLDAAGIDLQAGEIEITFANGQKTFAVGDLNFQASVQVPFQARYINPAGINNLMNNRDMGVIKASARYTLSIDGQAIESTTTTPVPVFFWKPLELSFPTIPCFVNDETDGNLNNLTYQGTTNRMQLRSNRNVRLDLNALGTLSGDGRTIWGGPFNVTPLFLKGDMTTFDIDGLREALETDLARDRAAFLAMNHRLDFTGKWQDRGSPDAYSIPLCITTIKPQGIFIGGGGSGGGGGGGSISGWSGFTPPTAPLPNEHGTVKIQIDQKTSLERQAFNVKLAITPNVQPLTAFTVNLHINDDLGNDARVLFYQIVTKQVGIDALTNGTVTGPAEIDWQVVPSSEAGGTLPAGKNYTFWATIDYQYGGTPYNVTTLIETETVLPMPKLTLNYTLPYVTMSGKPVKLAVHVTNNGFGPARSLVIQSAQPKILENVNNIPISFTLQGSSPTASVSGYQAGNITIAFGDVAAGGSADGFWLLSTSKNGYFVEMTAALKHLDYLGVQLDPLIDAANTLLIPALGGVIGPVGSTAGMTVELLQSSVLKGQDTVNDRGSYLMTDLAPGIYTWNLRNTVGGLVYTQPVTVVGGQPTAQVDYTLTSRIITATAGPNGAISPAGAVAVADGSTPSFMMLPDLGYHVADVSVDGSSVGPVPVYMFSAIVSDHTISAAFALNSYTITASAVAHGTISPSGPTVVSHGTGTVTYTITPDAGYALADVLVDGSSVGPVPVFNFTNIASNHSITASFTSTCGTITLSPVSLPTGTQGTAYSQTLVASGGTGTYNYTVTAGALPNGLSLTSSGTFTGTATLAGTFNFTVTATDTNACTGSQASTMTINQAACVTPPSGLVSWWQGEGSANDQMGLNHGTLVSGATFTTGRVGEAFNLNGSSAYVDVADAPFDFIDGSNPFTVEAWIYPRAGNAIIVGKHSISQPGWWLGIKADGRLELASQGNWTTAGSSTTVFGTNTWYHVVATYDGSAVRYYVNGAYESVAPTPLSNAVNNYNLTIGSQTGSFYFNGLIDEVQIYNRALNATEIAAIYDAGGNGVCDTIAPTVKSKSPAVGTTNVPVSVTVTAAFSEAMDPSTINGTTFLVSGATGSVTYDPAALTATFTPSANLAYNTLYTAMVTTGAKDPAGNGLATAATWTFTTSAASCPTITLAPASLPTGTQGSAYIQTLVASGGTGTYSYTVTAGALPNGLSLTSSGTFTGTATLAGTYNFTVTATDTNACTGSQAYAVMVNAAASTLTVAKTGAGGGTVSSLLTGISCGGTCSTDFGQNSIVVLTAAPAAGSYFNGWSGGCVSSSLTCLVTMDAAKTVNADFTMTAPVVQTWYEVFGGSYSDMAYAVQQTADGGYIVAGHTASYTIPHLYDAWLHKLDASGAVQWQMKYGDPSIDEVITSVQQIADGGYIVAGGTSTPGRYDAWLMRVDGSGTMQWQTSYGGSGQENASSVRQTADGGFIVAGFTDSFGAGSRDAWIVKLDTNGAIQWQKAYGGTGGDKIVSIRQVADGGYIAAGTAVPSGVGGDDDGWIMRLDASGSVIWSKAYGGTNWDRFTDIVTTADGGYAAYGTTQSFGPGGTVSWLLKLDGAGAVQWQNTYGGSAIYGLQQTVDGGFVAVGQTGLAGAGYGGHMLKTDATGSVLWQKAYGGTTSDQLVSVQMTADGGYVAAGSNFPVGGGPNDVWVLKTDGNGNIQGCAAGAVKPILSSAATTTAVPAVFNPTVTTTSGTAQSYSGVAAAATAVAPAVICPDTTPPTIVAVDPADLATGVLINGTVVTAIFSEPMDPATINASTFLLSGTTGSITYTPATNTATFTPLSVLNQGTLYTATVTTGAKDTAGNALAIDFTWSFTTVVSSYTITATAGTHGGIAPSGTVIVSAGTSTTFTILPNPGYSVATVTVDLVSVGSVTSYTFSNVTADHTIIASFLDNIPPTGSISINGGAPATASSVVTLTLICSDQGSGCSQMAFSSDGASWSGLATFQTTTTWMLTGADGDKFVHVRFVDADGNLFEPPSAMIRLDRVAPATAASPAGGTYPANQTVTLTCSDGLGAGCSLIRYTKDGSDPLVSGLTYTGPILITGPSTTLQYYAIDLALNAEPVQTQVYVIDLNAPLISSVTPTNGAFINTADVSYTLSKLMASGSVVFTRTSGTADLQSPHTHTMAAGELTAGSHAVSTGLPLKDGTVYAVAFSASDGAVSAPTVTSSNVTFDLTVAASITSPIAGMRVNTPTISYLLSEPATTGQIIITDGASQTYVRPLAAAELTAGPHTINTGAPLVNNGVYSFSLANLVDRAGNSSTITVPNVTFDIQAVVITSTMPSTKSIITAPYASYVLSEQAASGAVTFTRTHGTADPSSPHRFTLRTQDRTAGAHPLDATALGITLVDGAFYTVQFSAIDEAGNTSMTVSNALVFMDSTYDPVLVGNVDNTGASANHVDAADVAKMNRAMDSRPGFANWNPVCDLDRNGIVDLRDLMLLMGNYGR